MGYRYGHSSHDTQRGLRTAVGKTPHRREAIEPPLSQQVRRKGKRTEDLRKRGVADIEAACVGPEGRHHQATSIADETTPRQGASASADARDRMQMAGDFARAFLRHRLVAKQQRTKRQRFGKNAANAIGRIRVVVAGDPDPVATALKLHKFGAIGGSEARRSALIVEIVSERDDDAHGVARQYSGKPLKGRCGVIGRQQNASRREGRSFLKMQV